MPVLPTLIVGLAMSAMIWLGFWQIDRLHQKETMLAHYNRAFSMNADAQWPRDPHSAQAVLYRHATLDCVSATNAGAVAGRNDKGQSGFQHAAACALADGGTARVILGWSENPAPVAWSGGHIQGTIAPGPRLVAAVPVAGLAPNQLPDPSDIPNNHFSYAVQWFLFAGIAAIIYLIALRRRRIAAAPAPR